MPSSLKGRLVRPDPSTSEYSDMNIKWHPEKHPKLGWYFYLGEGRTYLGPTWADAQRALAKVGIITDHPDRRTRRDNATAKARRDSLLNASHRR